MKKYSPLIFLLFITLFISSCQNKEFDKDVYANAKIAGAYHTLLESPDSSASCGITISLAMDSTAVLYMDYQNGDGPIISRGKWHHKFDKIILEIDLMDKESIPTKEKFIFELINEDLFAIEYDTTKWGGDKFQLRKIQK